jgi:hypothetical protein
MPSLGAWIVPCPIITQAAPWMFHLACERLWNQADRHMTKKHERSVAKWRLIGEGVDSPPLRRQRGVMRSTSRARGRASETPAEKRP